MASVTIKKAFKEWVDEENESRERGTNQSDLAKWRILVSSCKRDESELQALDGLVSEAYLKGKLPPFPRIALYADLVEGGLPRHKGSAEQTTLKDDIVGYEDCIQARLGLSKGRGGDSNLGSLFVDNSALLKLKPLGQKVAEYVGGAYDAEIKAFSWKPEALPTLKAQRAEVLAEIKKLSEPDPRSALEGSDFQFSDKSSEKTKASSGRRQLAHSK